MAGKFGPGVFPFSCHQYSCLWSVDKSGRCLSGRKLDITRVGGQHRRRSMSAILLRRIGVCLLSLFILSATAVRAAEPSKPSPRPNVLFIATDDLNHWVGYLGRNPQTKTPNIDRLAARGVWFTRSYCAAPVCNPSRAALMSGLRPFTSGVYEPSITAANRRPRVLTRSSANSNTSITAS